MRVIGAIFAGLVLMALARVLTSELEAPPIVAAAVGALVGLALAMWMARARR